MASGTIVVFRTASRVCWHVGQTVGYGSRTSPWKGFKFWQVGFCWNSVFTRFCRFAFNDNKYNYGRATA